MSINPLNDSLSKNETPFPLLAAVVGADVPPCDDDEEVKAPDGLDEVGAAFCSAVADSCEIAGEARIILGIETVAPTMKNKRVRLKEIPRGTSITHLSFS